MQKRILKKIAAEWAAGILLHGTGMDSFDEDEDRLTSDETGYIVEEVGRIALRITKGEVPGVNSIEIVQKYYDFE